MTTPPNTGGNKPMMRALQGKRSSNAATPHRDKRHRRARTRASARNRALKDHRD